MADPVENSVFEKDFHLLFVSLKPDKERQSKVTLSGKEVRSLAKTKIINCKDVELQELLPRLSLRTFCLPDYEAIDKHTTLLDYLKASRHLYNEADIKNLNQDPPLITVFFQDRVSQQKAEPRGLPHAQLDD
jgi:hypothetical protein